ncbi:N(4)-(Beta-N-acetylglucosaminyl)-L-asparaginase [Melipona quadrifasciata]|uniref:N(4)-(beta-N-acetylglucosaminyl)-L-asparaginase n=1 Tax=Melipona quadrifasciata TaxID=166423 RepID=A0A0M9A246_9HYME|nr:N(4)-(Beta-N-acetylglucosaminyl)-L-asparaginase [Melipona quadrifasciata]
MKHLLAVYLVACICLTFWQNASALNKSIPLVVITWDYKDATQKAWNVLNSQKRSALDAIEESCSLCEEQRCRTTVGYGGSPDESVARKVLENTKHSLLGGDLAADFAVEMGFKKESLQTEESKKMWLNWKANRCQPNFWKNVDPDPKRSCGPYHLRKTMDNTIEKHVSYVNEENHDTIGVVAIDSNGHIAAGTSTNGAKNKIPGRIGDSPIAGAGAYADQKVGAAAGTGDGDIMMRFLPTFVEEMRRGATPTEAATTTIRRIAEHYPTFSGAVIAINKDGEYGAACNRVINGGSTAAAFVDESNVFMCPYLSGQLSETNTNFFPTNVQFPILNVRKTCTSIYNSETLFISR